MYSPVFVSFSGMALALPATSPNKSPVFCCCATSLATSLASRAACFSCSALASASSCRRCSSALAICLAPPRSINLPGTDKVPPRTAPPIKLSKYSSRAAGSAISKPACKRSKNCCATSVEPSIPAVLAP